MELTAGQKKEEQKRRRFIANAWMLLEKTGQAPAPSKDYCQLLVTTEGVVWRWWRISLRRSAVVYPGEWAVNRDDVEDDDRLLGEVERTFGLDVRDQVIHLCTRSNDYLSKLPQKILVKIAAYLALEDVVAMAHCSKAFRRTCLTDSLWRSIFQQHHDYISPEVEHLALQHTWRKIFFTDKIKLQMLVSRHRSQMGIKTVVPLQMGNKNNENVSVIKSVVPVHNKSVVPVHNKSVVPVHSEGLTGVSEKSAVVPAEAVSVNAEL